MHVADSLCRRVAEARHDIAGPPEPRRESQNPTEQGQPDHSAHHLHRRLRPRGDGLLGEAEEADRVNICLHGAILTLLYRPRRSLMEESSLRRILHNTGYVRNSPSPKSEARQSLVKISREIPS
jgi:hypothetical protein